ncbi:MAG: MBL fold metallo-hydrolase, partial [Gammaproteobacteria bacterium]|nr:MBL fold metallo-hydrolase [Gammaproteobacteria bacterium]
MKLLAIGIAASLCVTAIAHDPLSFDEISDAFWPDRESTEIETQEVAPGLHVFFGVGGNVAVSIGDNGVLIVDDQFPRMAPKIRTAIDKLGGGAVDFIVNSHWHFDHADGNPSFGKDGTWIVSQANSRRMMTGSHLIDLVTVSYDQPPYPPAGLPVITYDDRMQFHFNGQRIDLLHPGPAHTTGDTAVIFRGSNAVHLGDVYNNTGYPFIDAGNGGEIKGMIAFCQAVLDELDESSTIIPGHGPVASYGELVAYVHMLATIRDRISA